jgi:hypothetical protein
MSASRQIAISGYRQTKLVEVLEAWPVDEIAMQGEFEHLFVAGQAALEKVAAAIDVLLGGSGLEPDFARAIRRIKDNDQTQELGRELERWRYGRHDGKTIVDEGRDIRNAAAHHFYDKRKSPPGEWYYEVADSQRAGGYRSGRLDDFPVAYAAHFLKLAPIVERIAQQWGVPLEFGLAAT